MPQNLIVIIFFQAAIWCIVRILPKTSNIDKIQWIKVGIMGIIYGISMDIILGRIGIFSYLPNGPDMPPVEPIDLIIPLWVFNALASYGLAIATVALTANSYIIKTKQAKFWLSLEGIAFTFGLIGVIFSPHSSIQMMFSIGIILVSCGEMILASKGYTGPIIALFSGTTYAPFLKLWIFSVLVGTGYEAANYLFPFWVWLPDSAMPAFWLRILIIFFGYFVLFHSMTILWVLLGSRKREKMDDLTENRRKQR